MSTNPLGTCALHASKLNVLFARSSARWGRVSGPSPAAIIGLNPHRERRHDITRNVSCCHVTEHATWRRDIHVLPERRPSYFRRTAATREPTRSFDLLFAHNYLPITTIHHAPAHIDQQ
jgi:hypothetical protein